MIRKGKKMITGVYSVDFKLVSVGHGSVNNHGSVVMRSEDDCIVSNHSIPKMRGFTPFTGKILKRTSDGAEYPQRKLISQINLAETPAYISENTLKFHLFPEAKYVSHLTTKSNVHDVLATMVGLVRGYMIPKATLGRKTSLHIESAVEQLCNGNYEQFSRSGDKEKEKTKDGEEKGTSLFSRTTLGDTEYITYGSISIADLQFICLDSKFGNQHAEAVADEPKHAQSVKSLKDKINSFLKDLNPALEPKVEFHENYVRKGSLYKDQGLAGLLLNEDAITVVVDEMLRRLESLYIRQAQGYMVTKKLTVDYNNSSKPMRIKFGEHEDKLAEKKSDNFAVYYEGVDNE
ncbi:type I-Fv CRISPR-associated protein Cas7fv [Vibrio alfacsensis]|uniref:type I-Fv CRISPR-associated protein Cas7fv n=1 Tax=Vibrio alfacsensis TaxID=1074311 RepID=UPI002ADDB136|nr:type I-Fv CRISPR-associated protein Cas7fv [Vibrio alfacsensis]WQE78184.1 type I-Fv CRISPR-associated protein Cas7fv [Vibrio alfacsensis]